LSEIEQEQEMEEYPEEIVIELPFTEGGSYLYVCSECGCDLTEIPYYNRFYCQNCGLHY
jgi:anaerobic ribonucleoside-triphosphate reductase